MKKFLKYLWFIIPTLIGIGLLIGSFCSFNNNPTLWSAIIGCASSLTFSAIVSWVVQYINDKSAQKKDLNLRNNIRDLTLSPVRKELNKFMREYYMREDQLVNKIPNLKHSISENGINIENITKNLFIFESIYKNYSKYSFLKKEDEKFVKINIGNYQIISQDMNTKYENLSKICKSCYENMERENIYNNLDIFTKFEIKTIKNFPILILSI